MEPIWPRLRYWTVELGVSLALFVLAVFLFFEAVRLGPGWGFAGPRPGFFPMVLTILVVIGLLGVWFTNYQSRDQRPFFEVRQEVVDILKVGLPIFFAVLAIRWAGLYITAGLYMAFFTGWYGRFKIHWALIAGILFPLLMWLVLTQGFNINMPRSMFYRSGILPV